MYIFIKQHANDGRDDCIYVNRPFFCFLYFFSVLLALVHLNKLVVCKNVHIQSFFFLRSEFAIFHKHAQLMYNNKIRIHFS